MELQVDDRRVFAATGGRPFDAGQPAVIFIHGAGMDHTVWQLQTRYFAYHGHSVLAVDLPGHGRSEGRPLQTSIGDMAAWVLRLMDAVGIEKAALVGHSMGALTALDVASRAPDRASALALARRGQAHAGASRPLGGGEKDDHLALDLITSWAFGRRAHLGGHRSPGVWMTGGGLRLLERSASGRRGQRSRRLRRGGRRHAAGGRGDLPDPVRAGGHGHDDPGQGGAAPDRRHRRRPLRGARRLRPHDDGRSSPTRPWMPCDR